MELIELLDNVIEPSACLGRDKPVNIEELDQEYPLTVYSTVLNASGNVLAIPGLADHGYVYLDGVFQVWKPFVYVILLIENIRAI